LAAAARIPSADHIAEFAVRRRELVGVRQSLSREQWARAGEHEAKNSVTIAQIAASIVEHEAEHRALSNR
jgi:hypothetical protein